LHEGKEKWVIPALNHSNKVLLVEDDETSKNVVCTLLRKKGLDVSWAGDGKEALRLFEKDFFDLILMDISLPYIDGYTLTGLIRAGKKAAKIPIIALTAHAMEGEKEKCLAAGMDDYLTKPIDIGQLSDLIDMWLGKANA